MSAVDTLQLLNVAYGGTKEERTHATSQLEALFQSDSAPYYLLELLRASINSMLPVEQSLSALIYAKNCLMHIIPDEVLARAPNLLEEIKQTLFKGVFQVPVSHRKIICECVSTIISAFQWNYMGELLPMATAISASCSTQEAADPPSVSTLEHASAVLEMLFVFTKRFKIPNLEPMDLKLDACAAVVQILHVFLEYNDFHISKLVYKIAESVVETALQLDGAEAISAAALDAWFVRMAVFPKENYQRASSLGGRAYEEYTKCVKRIAMITFSVLNDATRRRKAAPVAVHFLKMHAITFLEVWQRWLSCCIQTEDRSTHRKSEMFSIRYVKLCTLDKTLYREFIRPNAMQIIEHLLFPYLCFSEEDKEVFADESSLDDYVQYMLDEEISNGELTQRQAASNAILAMLSSKKKFHDPAALLQALLEALTAGLVLDTTEANFPRIYGFLHLLSILRKRLREAGEIWQGQMSQVLMSYVAPRLRPETPFPPLRCKAILVCQRYSKVPMRTEQDFASFITMLSMLVGDKDPRVRLAAIEAMCTLLEMKRARLYLAPALVPLVEECLYFLNRVQTTFVPNVLLHLATHFAPELTPVMGRLGCTLVQHFLATAFSLEHHQDVELGMDNMIQLERIALSAEALLEAIYTVVLSCSENKLSFLDMRPDLLKLVRFVLQQPDSFDFVEKALSIFLYVVNFSGSNIPHECWELLPMLFHSVESGIGVDFFVSIEEVIDNFVSGATLEFLSNRSIVDATFSACQKMLIGGVVCAPECKIAAAQLIEAMLHQAKGCTDHPGLLDAYLSQFVNLLLQSLIYLDPCDDPDVKLRVWIVAALMDCFYYNAGITFGVLVQSGAYSSFFLGFFDLFRGCVLETAAAGHDAGKDARVKKKGAKFAKRHAADSEAVKVTHAFSILTRKVILLGVTSLLRYVTQCVAQKAEFDMEAAAATAPLFVEHYLHKTVALAQYCIFTNGGLYAERCRASERDLHSIRSRIDVEKDIEDDDMRSEDVLGLDGADDTEAEAETGAEARVSDGGYSSLLMDESDNYESPIDDINEVEFFLEWLEPFLQQEDARNLLLPLLRPSNEFTSAAQTAQQHRWLCKELEVAMCEDYQERQRRAAS